jgi:hypothetical protein
MTIDTRTIRQFAQGGIAELPAPAAIPSANLWEIKPFRSNSAVSKMLALMLAHRRPLDLVNGQNIDVDKSLSWSNDKEYHHFFPQAYLARRKITSVRSNVVANIILLTSKSSIDIRDSAPSEYLREILNKEGRSSLVQRMESNLVPEKALAAGLADDYDSFLEIRANHLYHIAQSLAGTTPSLVVDAVELDDSDDDPME